MIDEKNVKRNMMILFGILALFALMAIIKAVITKDLDYCHVIIFGLHVLFLKLIIDVNKTEIKFFHMFSQNRKEYQNTCDELVKEYDVPTPLKWFYR